MAQIMEKCRAKIPHRVCFKSLLRALFCLCLMGLWLAGFAPGTALASGMALADEDMLSDVSAQVGIGLVLEGGGTIGVIAYRGRWSTTAETGTLSYRGVTITGNLAGGRFTLGHREFSAHRVFLDVGTAGGQTRMRLLFPNMLDPDRPMNIRVNNSWWGYHNAGGAQYMNLGQFNINGIYHNQSKITLWAGNGGARGLIELNAQVRRLENRPTRAAGLRGFAFENFSFYRTWASDWSGALGAGYATFGTAAWPMSIDVYTDVNVGTRTRMRIIYAVEGTTIISRTGIIDSAGAWVRPDGAGYGTYGIVLLNNYRPNTTYAAGTGHVEITLPIGHGTFRWVGP